jgi:hypothetical protein
LFEFERRALVGRTLGKPLASPRLIEITVESRVIKKIVERGRRMIIFLLRPNLFLGR